MFLKNCSFTFDNRPYGVFYSGETIIGSVNLKLEKNKKCNALMLKISGVARCKWAEHHGSGKNRRTVWFNGNEELCKFYANLIAEQNMQRGESDLIAGNHKFHFKFVLPSFLPSSCETSYGYVRYTIKVTLSRSYKLDLCYKSSFTVLSHVDLNTMPKVLLPVVNESMKNFYFLFSKMGALHMTIKLPFSGFVSGQSISVTCNLKNRSKVKVENIKVVLIKTIGFTAKYPYEGKRSEISKVAHCTDCGVDREAEKTIELTLSVPALPPSSNMTSSIIEIKYDLKVTAVISGMHSNLKCSFPIIIGTVPIFSHYQTAAVPSTSLYEPSAPPAPNELAMLPPSYEEVLMDKRMEESLEDWDHSDKYTLRYPVYNFNLK